MTEYSLNITIDTNQFQSLKKNGYNLCIARKFPGGYTTIWKSTDLAEGITLSWQEAFRISWLERYDHGIQVEAQSNPLAIAYGQRTAVLPDTSLEDLSGKPDDSKFFTMINRSKNPVNVAVECRVGKDWETCYVGPHQLIDGGGAMIKPLKIVKVWFQQNALSSSMATGAVGAEQELSYDGKTARKVAFKGDIEGAGYWSVMQ